MYKGQLKDFPREIVDKMLEYQVKQGNPRDISVFESIPNAEICFGGFTWRDTIEGVNWWSEVIDNKNFNVFFKKYPKTSQYPKVMIVS